jgi:hypothetical protein
MEDQKELQQMVVVLNNSFNVVPIGQGIKKLFPKGSRGQIVDVDADGIALVQMNHDVGGRAGMPVLEIPINLLDPV